MFSAEGIFSDNHMLRLVVNHATRSKQCLFFFYSNARVCFFFCQLCELTEDCKQNAYCLATLVETNVLQNGQVIPDEIELGRQLRSSMLQAVYSVTRPRDIAANKRQGTRNMLTDAS